MAIQRKLHYSQDLQKTLKIKSGEIAFNTDNDGIVIYVDLFDGGSAASISGNVVGAIIRPDGTTRGIQGSFSGNTVNIALDGASVAMTGQIKVGIQVISGTIKTTVFKAVYDVIENETNQPVGSDTALDVADLINQMQTVAATIPPSADNLRAAIAPTFDTSEVYVPGQYVWYNGVLYICTDEHSGTWNAAHFQIACIDTDLNELEWHFKDTGRFVVGNGDVAANYATAFGLNTEATGLRSHAEGMNTLASGNDSHTEGTQYMYNSGGHAQILRTTASGNASHAEGAGTTASGAYSHSEGLMTVASGANSHAEGNTTEASGANSHAEGNSCHAIGTNSHAEGLQTQAYHRSQHVFGEYNILDNASQTTTARGEYIEIVGNGEVSGGLINYSNARTLDWDGNEMIAGNLTIGGDTTLTKERLAMLNGLAVATVEETQSYLGL